MTTPVFRFAPSPNGALHLGHAYSALLNFAMAREAGGRFLLRIEDIDIARCTPELEEQIYRDLAWLGLEWETPVRRQSEHFDDYAEALERLVEAEIVYPSFMSRGEVRAYIADAEADGQSWPRDPDGAPLFPPLDKERPASERRRRMEEGEPFAWRLDMEAAMAHWGRPLFWDDSGSGPDGETGSVPARPEVWGDVVIARKEMPASYHLSVVVDDALQGVTHVVRGRDLFHATAVHRLLQELLGLPVPAYHHHALILDEDGRKLSKSRGDTGIAALRAAGTTPGDVGRMVGLEVPDEGFSHQARR
ncbi:tRNA glutamyl-Q(34) synthetase GluQRS [Chelativorans salis]|uniref:tRNA glutamyl-Q(34) synthetase GluQRS n=1 Tax=Chelativorans salis TaxID=2978478 RepID=A0ABT2LSD6_9HYPH|nr:tRNA glutamyl-Q(34) synthetase GluQRS [Chelativorans sp. EGI FJ00035]MCT7377455.1 tRNA glutamyl-Q(34) synthetase GluQRS [Chelativorans sp. EGI FJ00035]